MTKTKPIFLGRNTLFVDGRILGFCSFACGHAVESFGAHPRRVVHCDYLDTGKARSVNSLKTGDVRRLVQALEPWQFSDDISKKKKIRLPHTQTEQK